VPDGRDGGEKVHALRLPEIVRRAVAEHLQGAVIQDIHGQLTAACADAHGAFIDVFELVFAGITHCPRREIHGASHHAGKRQGDGMLNGAGIGPFIPLVAADAFLGDVVGISSSQTGGLECAVEINEHLILGGFGQDAFIVVDHPLVVTLHEIDFQTDDTPPGELLEGGLQLPVKSHPAHPEDNADIFLLAVIDNFRDIHAGFGSQQVVLRRPAIIDDDIFNAVFGGKIDVVFVRFGVDAGFEINSIDVIGIPPVPGNFARLDPGGILELARFGQFINHLIGQQVFVGGSNNGRSPGECTSSFCFGQIVGPGFDFDVQRRGVFGFQGGFGQNPSKTASGSPLQIQTGVVSQVRFDDGHFGTAGNIGHNGQRSELFVGNGFQLHRQVFPLRMAVEAVFQAEINRGIAGQGEFYLFIYYLDCTRQSGCKTIGDAVVIGPDNQAKRIEMNGQFIVNIRHDTEFFRDNHLNLFINRAGDRVFDGGIRTQLATAIEGQANRADCQQVRLLVLNG